jgi:RNA polymerase sigma-70 factor (ECF subfamily)
MEEQASTNTTARLDRCLARLQAGDAAARQDLIYHACGRLQRLTRKMLHGFRSLRRWEESDDILQNSVLRLSRALNEVTPQDVRQFFRLAALQIRRELIDLARHYKGPEGLACNHESVLGIDPDKPCPEAEAPSSLDPARLAQWTELHEHIARLPEDEREVVELIWYQGLTQAEVARMLHVTDRTVRRWWQRARLKLSELFGNLPEDVRTP